MARANPPDAGASRRTCAIRFEHAGFVEVNEAVAVEIPLSISFNGQRLGVMLASPCDIEDFIIGFALSEGIIDALDEISNIEILEGRKGHIVSVSIPQANGHRLSARQRVLAGKSSCGLCGTESLEHAMRPIASVEPGLPFRPCALLSALNALPTQWSAP